jgi:hypothetical protein
MSHPAERQDSPVGRVSHVEKHESEELTASLTKLRINKLK